MLSLVGPHEVCPQTIISGREYQTGASVYLFIKSVYFAGHGFIAERHFEYSGECRKLLSGTEIIFLIYVSQHG